MVAAQKAKCAEYDIELEMVALPVQTLNADRSRIPAFVQGDFKQGELRWKRCVRWCARLGTRAFPRSNIFCAKWKTSARKACPWDVGTCVTPPLTLKRPMRRHRATTSPLAPSKTGSALRLFGARHSCGGKGAGAHGVHPCDPWLPLGFKGVDRVSRAEGFKHFAEICPSPYHGLNLCLGCMAEALKTPLRTCRRSCAISASARKFT